MLRFDGNICSDGIASKNEESFIIVSLVSLFSDESICFTIKSLRISNAHRFL